MNKNIIFSTTIFFLLFLITISCFAQQSPTREESITITTYYPSPAGSYRNLYVSERLGIGTIDPQKLLHIEATSGTPGIRLHVTGGNNWDIDTDGAFHIRDASNTADLFRIDQGGGYDLKGWVNGAFNTVFSIPNSSGNLSLPLGTLTVSGTGNSSFAGDVGIGTPGPEARLDINSPDYPNDIIQLYSGGSTQWHLGVGNSGGDYFTIYEEGQGTNPRLLIRKGDGDVGIGTPSPGAKLEISGGGTSNLGLFHYSGTGAFESRFGRSSGEYLSIEGDDVNYAIVSHNDADENNPHNLSLKNFAAGTGNQSISFWVQNNSVQTEAIRISGTGNVGIGTTNPLSKLSVGGDGVAGYGVWALGYPIGVYGGSGSGDGIVGNGGSSGVVGYGASSYGVYGRNASSYGLQRGVGGWGLLYDFYADGPSTKYGPFTGAHDVKLDSTFPKDVLEGLIVCTTGRVEQRKDSISSTLPTVKLSDVAKDSRVFGVIVAEQDLPPEHWYKSQESERFGVVNALGEGRVWVSNVNGEIKAGDFLTTSEIPGYGQRQDDDLLHNYTLGKATEDVDWDKVTKTVEFKGNKNYKVYLIAVTYHSG